VTQRPRDLTRAQLKELRLLLDAAGFSETNLQVAWREMTNEDIAASIIGFIGRRRWEMRSNLWGQCKLEICRT
jgi:hypothetical protein